MSERPQGDAPQDGSTVTPQGVPGQRPPADADAASGGAAGIPPSAPGAPPAQTASPGKAKRIANLSVMSLAMLTAAAVVTSLRGLPTMAKEELTMFAYLAFAVVLFLIPASLVAAELGGAFRHSRGGVYTWVGSAFGKKWGFQAVWLQWIQNVVWYPTGLGFAAAAIAYIFGSASLAQNNIWVGVFCILIYWFATLITLSGTELLVKVAKAGFVLGTIIPGLVLLGLFVYWVASGQAIGWETATEVEVSHDGHPRWLPYVTGLSSMAFLASIILLFAGPESQAVHVSEMKNPGRGYPLAMMIAAIMAFTIFALGSLAIAGILPYADIDLQSGVFLAFERSLDAAGIGWLLPVLSLLIGYGALSGALAWLGGPSKALLSTAQDGFLPPFMKRTNRKGIQRNILLVQGVVVTAISCIYFVMDDVSSGFFLISAMTVCLYIVMYLVMYAAAITLRYTKPDLPRTFTIPGGRNAGMCAVAGVGFLAVAFAFVLSFVPPSQLPIGSPALYVFLVAAGLVVFAGAPLVLARFAKPSWRESAGASDTST